MPRSFVSLAAGLAMLVAGAAVAAPAPAHAATSYSFSCTHQLAAGRAYTKQTVTGTVTGSTPSNVSVINYQGTVLVAKPKPTLDNAFWNGYWKTTYHDNQWKVGTDASNNTYYLMFPDTAPGTTFTATLVSLFNGGAYGNWQNAMPCTLT